MINFNSTSKISFLNTQQNKFNNRAVNNTANLEDEKSDKYVKSSGNNKKFEMISLKDLLLLLQTSSIDKKSEENKSIQHKDSNIESMIEKLDVSETTKMQLESVAASFDFSSKSNLISNNKEDTQAMDTGGLDTSSEDMVMLLGLLNQ